MTFPTMGRGGTFEQVAGRLLQHPAENAEYSIQGVPSGREVSFLAEPILTLTESASLTGGSRTDMGQGRTEPIWQEGLRLEQSEFLLVGFYRSNR